MGTESSFEITPLIISFLTIEALTLIGFLLVLLLFKNFSDKGLAFAKIVALIVFTYIVWTGSSLKIIQFTQPTLIILFIFLIFLSFIFLAKKWQEIQGVLKKQWKLLLFEELLFWSFFSIFLLIRWGNPDLWHPSMGGEKPMDFAFLNAITRTETFPPYDPWFAGEIINYYYFGQLMIAALIKLTGITPSVFYNIALAYLFAQSAVGAFSIVFNLTKKLLLSFLGSIFLLIIGNLAQIPLIIKSLSTPLPINAWYWTATRVMPNYEINEFPFFTFLYADLHSHLIALPIALCIIGLCLTLFQEKLVFNTSFFLKLGFLSLFLGVLRITNLWDYPSFLLLSITILTLVFLYKNKINISNLLKGTVSIISIIFLSNLLVFPFITEYKTGPLGLGIYQGSATLVKDYLLIHGFFLFILISFFLSSIHIKSFSIVDKLLGLILFLPIFIYLYLSKLWFLLLFVFFLFLGIIAFVSIKGKKQQSTKVFIIILSLFAIFLTLIPDIIDFKLGLGRMNTVFKFYFQAWILYALASAGSLPFIFFAVKKSGKIVRFSWYFIFTVLFIASSTYPPTATIAKIRDRMSTDTPKTLDGMAFMKDSYYFDQGQRLNLIWDYQAITWLNDNISGTPVILEGNAPIYRWGSRVSVYTGLPTVIGWDWHEKAHRSYLNPYEIDERVNDVKKIYQTNSLYEFWQLVDKYNIQYIYMGELERAYYGESGIINFKRLNPNILQVVYKNPKVTIYKIVRSSV